MDWKLISWNVNGIRAAEKKGFLDWLSASQADMVALQETKASPEQLSLALLNPPGYQAAWNSAEKKGYSGTVTYTRQPPLKVINGLNEARFDTEGRVLIHEFEPFVFFNIYFPNGGRGAEWVSHKLAFYRRFLEVAQSYMQAGRRLQYRLCRDRPGPAQGECGTQRLHAGGTAGTGRILPGRPG